jgi:hypothetical protein
MEVGGAAARARRWGSSACGGGRLALRSSELVACSSCRDRVGERERECPSPRSVHRECILGYWVGILGPLTFLSE